MLHAVIHALGETGFAWDTTDVDGRSIKIIDLPATAFQQPLATSFDDALEALAALPRLFIEPDGSFIWLGEEGPQQWKLDGQLNDSPYGLMTIELKISGAAPWPGVETVLRILKWPSCPIAFELVRKGVYVDVETLHALLTS